jgi:hypothetical protein
MQSSFFECVRQYELDSNFRIRLEQELKKENHFSPRFYLKYYNPLLQLTVYGND